MWSEASHQEKMKASVAEVVAYFKAKGIEFSPVDGKLKNVVFTSKDKVVKLSHHSFYGYSGAGTVHQPGKDKGATKVASKSRYLLDIIKPIIDYKFNNEV